MKKKNQQTLFVLIGGGVFALFALYKIYKRVIRMDKVIKAHDSVKITEKAKSYYANSKALLKNRNELQSMLDVLHEKLGDGDEGLISTAPPVFKKISRESIVMLGGGASTLMQIAHPFVAQGIISHSNVLNNPKQRFLGTFKFVFRMIFGDWNHLVKACKTVWALHASVKGEIQDDDGGDEFPKGTPYNASNQAALLYIMANLSDMAVFTYELLVGDLTLEEKQLNLDHARNLAYCFGCDPNLMYPPDWETFLSYNAYMWSIIQPTTAAKRIKNALIKSPTVPDGPLRWLVWAMTPTVIREKYGVKLNAFQYYSALTFGAILAEVYQLLPSDFRYLTQYVEAELRLQHKDVQEDLPLISRFARFLAYKYLSFALPTPANNNSNNNNSNNNSNNNNITGNNKGGVNNSNSNNYYSSKSNDNNHSSNNIANKIIQDDVDEV